MGMTRKWTSAAKAGAALLIALAMVCSVFAITGESAFAKAASPGKIKASTVKRAKATVNSMTVSFGKAKNAKTYQVRYKKANAKKWKTVTSKKQKATLKSLKKYTKYNVQVRGVNGKKKGAWTKAKTFTTLGDYHTLTYDPGEGTLPDKQKKKKIRAGAALGEPPMPTLVYENEKIKAWFALWYTKPYGDGEEVHNDTLMGNEDQTIYAVYNYDSNGQRKPHDDTFFNIYNEEYNANHYRFGGGTMEEGLKDTNDHDNVKSVLIIIAGKHDCSIGSMYFRNDLTLKFRKSWNNELVTELAGDNNTFNGLEGFSAENVRFNFKRLDLIGTKKIDMTNVTIDGDLHITHLIDELDLEQNVETVELKNVNVKGQLWIAGNPEHKIKVKLTNCKFEGGVYLSNVTGDTIDKIEVTNYGCQLNKADIKTLQNSTITSSQNGSDGALRSGDALEVDGSVIKEIKDCTIRSTVNVDDSGNGLKLEDSSIEEINGCDIRSTAGRDGLMICPNSNLDSEGYVIKEINNSFISGENGLHMKGQDFSINKIKDTTILAAGGAALNLEKGEKGQPLLEFVEASSSGSTILYSSEGPVLSMQDSGKLVCLDDDMDDTDPPKPIGNVRLWGGAGIYAKGTQGTFELPDDDYVIENINPYYSTVANNDKVTECGHNFEGKEFYYVVHKGQ